MAEKASVTSVAFGDKKVNFGEKAKVKWARDGAAWMAYFRNGETRVFNPSGLSFEIREALMYHGLKQKLADKFADADTTQECVAATERVWDMLTSGSFTSGTRVVGPRENLVMLARALVRVKAAMGEVHTEADALAFVTGLPKADREALGKNRGIIKAIHEIQMEEAEDDDSAIEAFGKPETKIEDLPDAPM